MAKTRTNMIPKLPKEGVLSPPNTTDPTKPDFAPPIVQPIQAPQPTATPTTTPTSQPTVFKNEQGRPSGITVDGKTYLGLSPADVNKMSMADAEKNKFNPNYQPAMEQGFVNQQQQAQQQAQMQQQQLAQQFARSAGIDGMTQDLNGNYVDSTGAAIDWKQVGLSTAADKSAWATIGGLAYGGAAAGSFVVPGVGTVIGAIGGAVLGLGISVLGNVKQQKGENIAAYKSELTDGQKYLNQLTLLVQADPANADKYIEGYQFQKEKIMTAHKKLYAEASSNLNAIIEEDATRELAKFDNFFSENGGAAILDLKMQKAIAAPNAQQALTELAISQQSIGVDDGA